MFIPAVTIEVQTGRHPWRWCGSGKACREASGSTRHASRRDATVGCDALPSPWSVGLLSGTAHTADAPQGTGRVSVSIHCLHTVSVPPCRGCTCRTACPLTFYALHSSVPQSGSGSQGNCTVFLVSLAMPSPPNVVYNVARYPMLYRTPPCCF